MQLMMAYQVALIDNIMKVPLRSAICPIKHQPPWNEGYVNYSIDGVHILLNLGIRANRRIIQKGDERSLSDGCQLTGSK